MGLLKDYLSSVAGIGRVILPGWSPWGWCQQKVLPEVGAMGTWEWAMGNW